MSYLWTEQLNPELHYNTKQIKTPNQKKPKNHPPHMPQKTHPKTVTSLLSVKKKGALEVLVLAWMLWKCRGSHPNQEE